MNIRISFLGLRKSGKSSIILHIFNQIKPLETLNVSPTNNITISEHTTKRFKLILTEYPGSPDILENLT